MAWRERRSSRAARWVWTLAVLLGFAAWAWVVHRWAVTSGRDHLLGGVRPLYFGVAAFTYLPVAGGLWLLAFPNDRRPWPWAEEEEPLRYMGEADAEALAQAIREDTGLDVRFVLQGTHFAVDIDTPATRYRLTREEDWPALRRRLTDRRRNAATRLSRARRPPRAVG